MTASAKATRPGSMGLLAAALCSVAMGITGLTLIAMPSSDVLITDRPYIRHDAGVDLTIASCGSDATTPGPGGDLGGNRQQNEPAVAINPRNPRLMVASSNDACTVVHFGDGWLGFYVSRDGGSNWVNSLLPGYPTDTSAEGRESPVFNRAWNTGDPIMDWDNDNRLFLGGVAFNRVNPHGNSFITPTNADVIVSTWVVDDAPASPLGMNYLRTVVVGEGTPSQFFRGRFNDKPSLRVDDWPKSPHQGNVYVAWTLYSGIVGQTQIRFARSTDHGVTFSTPKKVTPQPFSGHATDIAVAPDGTVYVAWRQFDTDNPKVGDAIVIARSTDGGQSFAEPQVVRSILPYDRFDRNLFGDEVVDCGDGFFECVSQFVFHRTSTLPQIVADGQGTVFATWEELVSQNDNGDTYRPDGQGTAVVSKSTDGGRTWSAPVRIDPTGAGHQWWPNIEFDRAKSVLVAIYYDSREDPSYAPNRPPGNTAAATSPCDGALTCNVLNTYLATSVDGVSWTRTKVSSVGHQPEYEMYDNLDGTFHGDYLGIDAFDGVVFGVWTDNRDVVPGIDVRETTVDGFDILQCRASPTASNTCQNAGGLNQNIYGARIVVP
jgi:hypothetical protein